MGARSGRGEGIAERIYTSWPCYPIEMEMGEMSQSAGGSGTFSSTMPSQRASPSPQRSPGSRSASCVSSTHSTYQTTSWPRSHSQREFILCVLVYLSLGARRSSRCWATGGDGVPSDSVTKRLSRVTRQQQLLCGGKAGSKARSIARPGFGRLALHLVATS